MGGFVRFSVGVLSELILVLGLVTAAVAPRNDGAISELFGGSDGAAEGLH